MSTSPLLAEAAQAVTPELSSRAAVKRSENSFLPIKNHIPTFCSKRSIARKPEISLKTSRSPAKNRRAAGKRQEA